MLWKIPTHNTNHIFLFTRGTYRLHTNSQCCVGTNVNASQDSQHCELKLWADDGENNKEEIPFASYSPKVVARHVLHLNIWSKPNHSLDCM